VGDGVEVDGDASIEGGVGSGFVGGSFGGFLV
jgi:hypothetical protein